MTDRFAGKTVLITGGATGLGAAVAELVAAQGARVAVLDVNEAAGRATADRVDGRFWRCDVSDPRSWREVLSEVEGRLGPVRYAHLNAGVMTQGLAAGLEGARLENVTPERYRAVLGTNVDGVFFGIQALLPRMAAEGGDCITVTSSAAGLAPIPFDPVYALTKHALIGLVRSLALASAAGPVRINAVCPGGFTSQLVPPEFRGGDMMSPSEMGLEVVDLLLNGGTGETRLKLRRDAPAEAIMPPRIPLG